MSCTRFERRRPAARKSANLQHLARNIGYYRKEPLIAQVFSYGELAAFLRGLQDEGVDLDDVADGIDQEYPKEPDEIP